MTMIGVGKQKATDIRLYVLAENIEGFEEV